VRKGYSTFVQKLETDKQKINEILVKHKIDKRNVPKVTPVVENVSNINKKEKTTLQVEHEHDSLFIKTQEHETKQPETKEIK